MTKILILCSLGPSCKAQAGKPCSLCGGFYCKKHDDHGRTHATRPADWAACGHPVVPLLGSIALCDVEQKGGKR